MRLTRGCRAGGGVACPSLEYGGIRAATRRTPAPRDRLLLPASSHLPHLLHVLFFLLLCLLQRRSTSGPLPFSLPVPPSTPPGTSALVLALLPPAAFLVSSAGSPPTTATTTTMFPFLSKGTASSLLVWQSDREDGQEKRDGKE